MVAALGRAMGRGGRGPYAGALHHSRCPRSGSAGQSLRFGGSPRRCPGDSPSDLAASRQSTRRLDRRAMTGTLVSSAITPGLTLGVQRPWGLFHAADRLSGYPGWPPVGNVSSFAPKSVTPLMPGRWFEFTRGTTVCSSARAMGATYYLQGQACWAHIPPLPSFAARTNTGTLLARRRVPLHRRYPRVHRQSPA